MYKIFHSKGIGDQNWLEFGPCSCWMAQNVRTYILIFCIIHINIGHSSDSSNSLTYLERKRMLQLLQAWALVGMMIEWIADLEELCKGVSKFLTSTTQQFWTGLDTSVRSRTSIYLFASRGISLFHELQIHKLHSFIKMVWISIIYERNFNYVKWTTTI